MSTQREAAKAPRSRPILQRTAVPAVVLVLLAMTTTPSWGQQRRLPFPRRPAPQRTPARSVPAPTRQPVTTAQAPGTQPSADQQDPIPAADTQSDETPPSVAGPDQPQAPQATPVMDAIDTAAAAMTLPMVEQREQEAAALTELPDETQQRIAELYAAAKANLDRAAQLELRQAELRSGMDSAEARGKQAKAIALQLETTQPQMPPATDIASLEELLAGQQEELRTLKERKLQLDEQATKRAARRNEIRQRLAELEEQLGQIKQQATAPAVTGEPPAVAEAKQTEALTQLRVLTREKPTLEQELSLYDAEATYDLLRLERTLNAKRIEFWNQLLQLSTNALNQARKSAARTALDEAELTEKGVPEALRPIAEKSLTFAKQNQELTQKIQEAAAERKQVTERWDELKEKFNTTQAKVDAVGLPASVGAMLRNQRSNLPDAGRLRASIAARRAAIDDAQLSIFYLDEERTRLVNLESAARRELAELTANGMQLATEENLAVTQQLLQSRSELLDALHHSQTTYFEKLTDTSIAEEQLARRSEEFRDYIDERVLWIRSHPSLLATLRRADWSEEIAQARTPAEWQGLAPALVSDARRHPMIYFLAVLSAGILLIVRPFLAVRLKDIAERARGSAYSHFTPSLAALCINVVSSLFGPFVLAFLAWRLTNLPEAAALSTAVANGCRISAFAWLPLSFFSHVFAEHGLADAHFDWSPRTTRILRRNLHWVTVILLPLVFLAATFVSLQTPTSSGIVHRGLFLLACIAITVLTWQIIHPQRGLPQNYLTAHEGGWLERLQHLWFWGLLAIPISLGILTISGYAYTVRELAWRGFQSIAIVGFLWVLNGLFMRLLLVHRRKLSVERARARYAQYKQKRAAEEAERQAKLEKGELDEGAAAPTSLAAGTTVIEDLPGVSVTPDGIVMEEDPLADLRANTAQSRRLVNMLLVGTAIVMLWLTWHNVLPALAFLERWSLWDSTRVVVVTEETESGLTEIRTREVPDPVTIIDLMLACIVLVGGYVAARDLPGLLELSVLKRLPLENSVRYAITTLSSYALVFVGLFVACQLIGLRWQQIQWMATALTFGLAFGLQEMFANFVAGIIILFERPIRVGDIVTIDDVTGVVSRVRMRATTVTNWDRKDYIVPNKDFITGRLLNWTLSDLVNRIVINVGVAYGSDLKRAKGLLVQIAKDHPIIEDEPAPMATFEAFADSSLSLVLRCFIAMKNMPMRLNVIDELHSSIDEAFKEAKIEIAFPQQDLHIRDIPVALQSKEIEAAR